MTDNEVLETVYGILYEAPELHMSNYHADDVAHLNNAVISAIVIIDKHFRRPRPHGRYK